MNSNLRRYVLDVIMFTAIFLWGNFLFAQQEGFPGKGKFFSDKEHKMSGTKTIPKTFTMIPAESGKNVSIYSSDFESFTAGQKLACQDTTHWTTLNFTPCGSQDPVVSTDYARSGSESVKNSYTHSILRLGDKTSGKYSLSFWLYAPADYGGRYWFYHTLTPGSPESAFWFGFDEYGNVMLRTGGGDVETTYNQDQWFKVTQVIDLNQDSAWFYLNGTLLKNWKWSLQFNGQPGTNQLAAAHFDGSENNWTESPLFYLDDVEYEQVIETPTLYSTDFEPFAEGQKIACQDTTHWTTFNFTPCGYQDPVISTDYARSGTKSVKNSYTYSVLRLGDKTSGKYTLSFWLYAPADYGGRYWLYHTLVPNSQESACWFGFDEYGNVMLYTGGGHIQTTYSQDQWFKVTQVIDLDQDSAWFYLNGSLLKSWKWSLKLNGQPGINQLAATYFDGSENNWTESPLFYLDDVEYGIPGQNVSLAGKVTKLADGSPVSGTTITINNSLHGSYSATTAANGTYAINEAEAGDYSLTLNKEGLNKITDNVTIADGQTITKDYQLTAPVIASGTDSLSVALSVGETVTRTVTLHNTGNGPMDWTGILLNAPTQKISVPPSDGKFDHSPASYGMAPTLKNSEITTAPTGSLQDMLRGGSTAYVSQWIAKDGNDGTKGYGDSYFLSINTEDPYPQNVLGITHYWAWGATFDATHTNFLYNLNDEGIFRRLDIATCTSTLIGETGIPFPYYVPSGLICDKATGIFYASIMNQYTGATSIYTIDTTTGAATLIGTTIDGLIGIAIDGSGQMYGYSINDDNAYRINKNTGEATLIGSIGFDANYLQDIAWDPISDNIYLAATNVSSGNAKFELRILDRTTGNTTLVGPLKGENDALAFPGGGATWASITPGSGTIAAGDSVSIAIIFNGNYVPPQDNLTVNGNLIFNSDPNVGTATVALSMMLNGELKGSLSGTVTHGSVTEGGVTVKAMRQENPVYTYTAVTGVDGTYDFDSTMNGNYTITAKKEGFNPYSATALVSGGQSTIQNIAVTAPVMAIDSATLSATTPFGTVITRTLHITNDGDGPLVWNGSLQSNLSDRVSIPASDGNFEHSPASVGLAPQINKTNTTSTKGTSGSTAYGFDVNNKIFMSFNTDDPANPITIANVSVVPFGGTFDASHTGFMYIIDNNDGYIKKIEVATGNVTTVGPAGLQSGDTPTGLTCDKTTGIFYASSSDGNDSRIYTIDPVTGASTLINLTGIPSLIDITVDGSGQMYGYDITGDNAYAIDKTTGVSTLIGSIGFNASYAQGMCWNPATDNIYLASVNTSSGNAELRILDRTTGNTTLVGALPDEIDAFAFPGTSWLSMNPKTGTISAGDSAEITVTMDGNYLPPQSKNNTMTGSLTFSSNPNVGTIKVPVTFTIETDYGVLTGTVSHNGNGTEGVTLAATREEVPSYTYTAVSDANGTYTLTSVLPGTYDITAAKEGYNPYTAMAGAVVTGGQVTTYDIEMLAPVMTVSPSEIADSASFGNIITRTLTINNTGNGILNWTGIAMSGEGDKISIPASDGNFTHSVSVLGLASVVNNSMPKTGKEKGLLGGSTAYAFNIYPNNNFFSFNTDNPSNVTVIGPISNYVYGATFDAIHTNFMYIIDASGNFSKIDIISGEITPIGSLGFPVGYTPTGLSCDKTTGIIYASCSDGSGTSKLYTIDPLTGAGALIGDAGISVLIDIAIDGKGQMYGFDINSDDAYKIDKTTAASTKIGSIGFDAGYSQGMAWDPSTDVIYLAAYNVSSAVGELRIFDRKTGNTTLVGTFAGETDGLAFPGVGPAWLSIDPKFGTVEPGTSQEITVTLDGNYPLPSKESVRTGHVVISPEPNVGTVSVPVSFTIEGDIFGTLSGTVTHGNEPVEGVTLTITNDEYPSYTYSAVTGSDGAYAIGAVGGTYKVTAEATGYNGYLADAIEIPEGQTTTLNIPLTAPEMSVTPESVSMELPQNGTGESTLTISNSGDGVLEWTGGISYDNKRLVISVPSSKGDFPRGSDPVSFGPAPMNNHGIPSGLTDTKTNGSIGYGFDIYNKEFLSFNTNNPASSNTISTIAINPVGGSFDALHTSYMYTVDNEGFLRKVDIATGGFTNIGMCNTINSNQLWTGISVDKYSNVMYGVSSDGNDSYIYTIDMNTTVATPIGPTGIPACIDIAIDGGGQMYGYDVVGNKSYKIDKTTGTSTLLGFIGFDANYAEGMGWDPVTDVVYLAGYNNNTGFAELRALDKTTGNTQYIGTFSGTWASEVDGLAFPAKWLTASKGEGSVLPGENEEITLHFNAMDLPEGTYTANVVYNSNAGEGAITVPVTFTIVNPVLSVTPANQNVNYATGTTSFAVANTGAGTMNYTAAVTAGSDWLTITNGASGTNSGTIEVSFTENTTTNPRVATITVTAPGATGSPVTVTVTQGVNSALLPTFTIETLNNVPAGSITVPVHAANVVNMGSFQFTIEYDPALMTYNSASDWYTGIEAVTMGEPTPGHLTFVWAADLQGINIADGTFFNLNFNWLGSTSTSSLTWSDNPTPREFTDYDGNVFVSVYNNGSVTGSASQPILTVTPTNQEVTSTAGTTTFAVTNTGIGTMNYTAAVTTGNDWLTITSGGSGVNTGTINVAYTENTSTSPRTGTITVTAPGATGSPVNVTISQAAAFVPAAIVTITDTTTLVSGLFVVPVSAQNITNMGSFQFTIEYDPSIILFDSITNWYTGIDAVTTGNPSAGHITFVWAADLNGINIADGKFFDINFDWIASDVIQTQVNWSDNPTPREFADYNGNIFVPVYNNGTETGPDGIPEVGTSSIKVFPNPATDVVNITVSNDISTVQVMNYLGMIVYSENITQEKTITLNTSRYSAGNYLVRFVTNNGQTLIKKMVIIK